jgi:ABC-type sugar transport system ATPase subunit
MVFQNYALYPHMSVRDRPPHGDALALAAGELARVAVEELFEA